MENITVKDIVEITGGKLLCGDKDIVLKDICIDSRYINAGDLFIPLLGEKNDGHNYIDSAMKIGAATLTEQHDVMESDKPFIRVESTMKALQDIGVHIRNKYQIPFVGVTGSVGKTTTREMIAAALATAKNCYQTPKNYNSQIGVPITLSGLKQEHEVAVIEMGISEAGQMDILTNMVRPDICVVSVIGVAHMVTLKTQENIRKEKLSIIHGMPENGLLLINGDDRLLHEIKGQMPCRTMTYGCGEDCDYRACNITNQDEYTLFDCIHGEQRVAVKLKLLGRHNVRNCLAALAVADQMGISMEKAAEAFPVFEGQRLKLLKHKNGFKILDDTYNASPDSMRASIDVLCEYQCVGKRIAVLGDMLELGKDSRMYHKEIGEYLLNKQIDEVHLIGEEVQAIKKVLSENTDAKSVPNVYFYHGLEEISQYLLKNMKTEDIVLLKGSNGMKLKEVVNLLMK